MPDSKSHPTSSTSHIQSPISHIPHPTSQKSILITGGAGFIGSNFIPYFLEKYPNYHIVNLDLLTYAGNLDNLKEIDEIIQTTTSQPQNPIPNIPHPKSHPQYPTSQIPSPTSQIPYPIPHIQTPRYTFIKGNICNRELVEYIFETFDIHGVIHFAAESHVDNSITNPNVFVETNINGTFTLLDVAYKHWMEAPFQYKEKYMTAGDGEKDMGYGEKDMEDGERDMGYRGKDIENHIQTTTSKQPHPNNHSTSNIQHPTFDEIAPRFHHISTDEVYGTLGETGLFTETTPYAPNSPYSASKAAAELALQAYAGTFFERAGRPLWASVRAGNVIGGGDWAEDRIIPDAARALARGQPVKVRNPVHVRPWQHVLDALYGYLLVAASLLASRRDLQGAWNFGPDHNAERTVEDLVETFLSAWGEGSWEAASEGVTAPETGKLVLDSAKAGRLLQWTPQWPFEEAVGRTARWYRDFYGKKGAALELCRRDIHHFTTAVACFRQLAAIALGAAGGEGRDGCGGVRFPAGLRGGDALVSKRAGCVLRREDRRTMPQP